MSPGMFSDTLNLLTLFLGISFWVQKSSFFLRGCTGNFAKNDQILKNVEVFIFHPVKSLWTLGCRKHHLEIIFKYKQSPEKFFQF